VPSMQPPVLDVTAVGIWGKLDGMSKLTEATPHAPNEQDPRILAAMGDVARVVYFTVAAPPYGNVPPRAQCPRIHGESRPPIGSSQ